jgi:hypothetical protein
LARAPPIRGWAARLTEPAASRSKPARPRYKKFPAVVPQSSYWRGRIVAQPIGSAPMSSLDLELDGKIDDLGLAWREANEASIVARAEYLALSANPQYNAGAIDAVRERLGRMEILKARVLARIERLEDSMLGLG